MNALFINDISQYYDTYCQKNALTASFYFYILVKECIQYTLGLFPQIFINAVTD